MTKDDTKNNSSVEETGVKNASDKSVTTSAESKPAKSETKSTEAKAPAAKKAPVAKKAPEQKVTEKKVEDKKVAAKKTTATTTTKPAKKTAGSTSVKKTTAKKVSSEGSSEAIRIKLKSFDIHLLEKVCQQIIEVGKSFSQVRGPIPLPSSRHIDTILISPHKYKDARDQYEIKVYKRLIDILDVKPEFLDQLFSLNIPAGVDISPKVYVRKKA